MTYKQLGYGLMKMPLHYITLEIPVSTIACRNKLYLSANCASLFYKL